MEIVNMANMIEHSNFVAFKMKQEWEDEIKEEEDEYIKRGLIKRCMNCCKKLLECKCGHSHNEVGSTYWGY